MRPSRARQERFGALDVTVFGGDDGLGGGDGPLVVLCHGFGAPGDDLVPLGRMLACPPGTRFCFPCAPLSLGGFYGGDSRAWWMIDMMRYQRILMTGRFDELTDNEPDGLTAAREKLVESLDAIERGLGVRPGRMVLGGFSQGAMLSLDLALRTARPLLGLVVLSGALITRRAWTAQLDAGARRGLPVFQSHGAYDEILPYPVAEQLRDLLTKHELPVEFHAFDGGHQIPEPVLRRLGDFLSRVLTTG
jgi:phospholipase/carboxylesterase